MSKTIAIIPARGGSKRLPNKNILSLGGIPLIAHSILYAQKNSTIIDAIYVSTDDEAIKKIALEYGAKVIDRPEILSRVCALITLKPNQPTIRIQEPKARNGILEGGWAETSPFLRYRL